MKINEANIESKDNLPQTDFIINNLKQYGAFKITCLNFDIGETVLNYFATQLGNPSLDDVTNPNKKLPYIHEVRALASTILDKNGFRPYSLTNKELICHTEDYFNENASNIVLFYCVRPANTGGETYLVNIGEIISQLDKSEIDYLSKPIFPTPNGFTSILSYSSLENKYHIKYSRIIINKVAMLKPDGVTQEMKLVLDKLDILLSKNITKLHLSENSCIILDNTTVLHGRSSFNENSNRLIFRLKLNSNKL